MMVVRSAVSRTIKGAATVHCESVWPNAAMNRFTSIVFVILALVPSVAWCDWHDHFGHSGSHGQGTVDPEIEFFVSTLLLIIVASSVLLFLGGPVLVFCTRRTRHIFWIVPLVNFVLYVLSLYLRTYPGDSPTRLRSPGPWYAIFEIVLLGFLSLLIAVILAVIHWLIRKIRSVLKGKDRLFGPDPQLNYKSLTDMVRLPPEM